MHKSTFRCVGTAILITLAVACTQSSDDDSTNFVPGNTPTSPPVASVLPQNNQNTVPTNLAAIIVSFDQPVDVDSVSDNTLQISPAVNFSLDKSNLAAARVARFDLQSTLSASTTYTLNTNGIFGTNGTAVADTTWQFTTLSTADTTPPTKPTNLSKTITTSGTSVTLTWTASTDDHAVAGYRIYRDNTLVDVATSTSFTAAIDTNIHYVFSVEAFDFADNRSVSTAINVPTPSSPPPVASVLPQNNQNTVPTNLAAIIVSFDQPVDVDSVSDNTLQISPAVNFSLDKSNLAAARVARFDLQSTLSASTTYTLNTNGIFGTNGTAVADTTWQFTTLSTADTTPPTKPTNLSKTITTSGTSVTLTWTASTDDHAVAGYRIYRDNTLVDVATSTSFTAAIDTNIHYVFSVEAFDFADNRSVSTAINVPTPSSPPPVASVLPQNNQNTVPTNLAAIIVSFDQPVDVDSVSDNTLQISPAVNFSLDKSNLAAARVARFDLQSTLSASTTYTLNTNGIFGTNGTAVADTTWQFTTLSTADTTPPTKPTNLSKTITTSGTSVTLTWTASTDDHAVAGYRIYRDNTLVDVATSTSFTAAIDTNIHYVFSVEAFDFADNRSVSATINVPTSPPEASVLPQNNQNTVPTNLAAIIVSFDQPVDVDSVSDNTLQISPAVSFSLDKSNLAAARVARFDLQSALSASTTYTLNTTGITGTNGLTVADTAWHFTTLSTEDTTPPSMPSALMKTVAISGTSVTLTWTASTDDHAVAGYRIYRNSTLVGITDTTSFAAAINTNITYALSVEAFDFADNRSPRATTLVSTGTIIDTIPPSAPENIEIPILNTSEVGLSWDESTDNLAVKGYNIYRNNLLIGTTNTTSFFDNGLTESTSYAYTIEAFDYRNNTARTNILVTTKPVFDPTLTWISPTRREDNTCITQLEGVRVYYGNRSRNYIRDLDLKLTDPEVTCIATGYDSTCSADVNTCSYTPVLDDAKWYFVLTVYDADDRESRFSDQIFYDLTP